MRARDRRTHKTALILAFCLTGAALGCSPTWERFASVECGFSVLMPDTPEKGGAKLETSHGTLVFVWYAGRLPPNPLRSQVAAAYPGAGCTVIPEGVEAESLLQEFEQATPSGGDRVVASSRITVGGHGGVEVERASGDVVFIERMLAHDGKLFWLSVPKTGNALFEGQHRMFLDSFSISE